MKRNRVKIWLKTRRVSLRESHRMTGISYATLSRIQTGQGRVTERTARGFARMLKCQWHELVTETEGKTK